MFSFPNCYFIKWLTRSFRLFMLMMMMTTMMTTTTTTTMDRRRRIEDLQIVCVAELLIVVQTKLIAFRMWFHIKILIRHSLTFIVVSISIKDATDASAEPQMIGRFRTECCIQFVRLLQLMWCSMLINKFGDCGLDVCFSGEEGWGSDQWNFNEHIFEWCWWTEGRICRMVCLKMRWESQFNSDKLPTSYHIQNHWFHPSIIHSHSATFTCIHTFTHTHAHPRKWKNWHRTKHKWCSSKENFSI